MPTPAGDVRFQVAGVYYDYASNQGTVMIDRADYNQYFDLGSSGLTAQHLSIYLRPGAMVEEVRTRIRTELGDSERVFCVTSDEIRREALKIFESTFAVTYALQAIAILVAGLGVASTLITLIYKRKRHIGMMSLVGGTPRQVRRVIVWEAVLVGGASQLIGIVLGLLLAFVLIYVINVQSFGWTIQLHLPIVFISQSTLLVLVASALFGLYPAAQAAGFDALQTVREQHA
jgi:putative ABC transport system permease protein